MADPSRYLRCPCCGKQSQRENFDAGARSEHKPAAKIAVSLSRPGKRGGFQWIDDEAGPTPDEIEALAEAARGGLARLAVLMPSVAEESTSSRVEELRAENERLRAAVARLVAAAKATQRKGKR